MAHDLDEIELNENEREVLLGLVMSLVDADEERSLEEVAALRELGSRLGREQFLDSARRARRRFPTPGALRSEIQTVERQEARQAIFDLLRDVSMRDGLVAEEADLLEWLSATWCVAWPADSVEL